ncbi:MAG: hypothetical protein WC648_04335 [Candidatus Paceibacterota bacterium]|jgi:hypothetical protein
MSNGVEFDGDNMDFGGQPRSASSGSQFSGGGYNSFQNRSTNQGERGFVGFLLNHGWVKSPESARMIMIGIAIFNFIVSIVIVIYVSSK